MCEVSLCHCRSSNFPTAAAKRKREASRGAARLPAARPGLSLCPRTGSGHRTRARLSHAGHRGGVGRGAGRIARDRGLGWTLSRAGRAFKGKRPLTLPARPPAAAPPSRRGRAPSTAPAPALPLPPLGAMRSNSGYKPKQTHSVNKLDKSHPKVITSSALSGPPRAALETK